eukprot:6172813-Pleurochrysis_carterae.AAC.5
MATLLHIGCGELCPSNLTLPELAPDMQQHHEGDEEEAQHQNSGRATARPTGETVTHCTQMRKRGDAQQYRHADLRTG